MGENTKKNSIPIFALTSLINTADSVVEKYGLEEFDAIWPKPISEKNIEELLSYTVVGQYNVIRPSVFYNNQESLGNKGKDTSALSLELEKIVGYPIFFLPLSLYTLGRDEPLQKEILSIFHDNLEKNIIEIKEAYRDKNFNKIYQLVHNLKGSTGYVGAMRLDAMCKFFLNILVLYKNNLEKINKFYYYLEDVLLKTLQEL
ncbi:Hpt domain-containing protein [Rickettsiella massiliensis]|uniref:Hpt domain-containing protein n=1 Tax=Rickettsiella massiliensis TaxID=676517 RepID=UPI00029A362E|nr:Hpt domain-containing protein [Rickettsiella massiliensis]